MNTIPGTRSNARHFLAVVLIAGVAGCGPRIVDLRPYVAHPDQKLMAEPLEVEWMRTPPTGRHRKFPEMTKPVYVEWTRTPTEEPRGRRRKPADSQALVSNQQRIRTSVRYMRHWELDEIYHDPKVREGTANPFLYRPPQAPVKFTVFKINIRNESEHDAFGELDKFILRDDQGNVHRPLTKKELTSYWLGQVTIEIGDPVTWVPQMDVLERREKKQKSLVETVYTGGWLAPRAEHTGYMVFRDISETGKPRLPWYQRRWVRAAQFIVFTPIGYYIVPKSWRPPNAVPIGHVQLLLEITVRGSRYGRPLNVVPVEANFNMVKVSLPPEGDEEMDPWREP